MKPRVMILRAPGTNTDVETAFAFERAGAAPEYVHIRRLLERPSLLEEFSILCFPGGFSYGDDLSAGKVLATQARAFLQDRLTAWIDQGRLVLGICNGFQALVKTGILPGFSRPWKVEATLARNDSGHFEDRWVEMEAVPSRCVFTKGMTRLATAVTHGEGKWIPAAGLEARLREERMVVLRYASRTPGAEPAYPDDPNGSVDHVAGVCDPTGRVLGMMPHPEKFIRRMQHPEWTRRPIPEEGEGLQIFRNAVDLLK